MARPTCARCARPQKHCLCALIPDLANRIPVLILQHPSETAHALNTARFIVLGLQQVELWVGEQFPGLAERLAQAQRPLLLFPGETARPLAGLKPDPAPDLLVVLDGTWRKARKLLYSNPSLETLPRVTLPVDGQSHYRLRKADMPGALATIEAVLAVLSAWQPNELDELLRPFHALIDQQIEAMGEEVFQRNHGEIGL